MKQFGADIDLESGEETIRALLESLAATKARGHDACLHLAARRSRRAGFLLWNEVERLALQDSVTYHPYVDTCRRFPVWKANAVRWFDNSTTPEMARATPFRQSGRRHAARTVLFVSFMHPWKLEGNSKLMRDWLHDFKSRGYRIHLLYYAGDASGAVTQGMHADAEDFCELYETVQVASPLVGSNTNGLNIHVDDWCGPELLDAVSALVQRHSYDIAFVNYAFLSSVFDRVHAYTRKILLTHDRMEDRNRRMLDQGFEESGWLSLTRAGEALACDRADTVVAIQPEEAAYFGEISGAPERIALVSPVLEPVSIGEPAPSEDGRLRIGYFGAHNWVNELNFAAFLEAWSERPALRDGSSLVLAGGLCDHLSEFADATILAEAAPRMLGRVDDLADFFSACDLVINPERGGTGLKIKSLETMAHGVPLLSTSAGAVGFGSDSRFHSAPDIGGLADLVTEVVRNPALLTEATAETKSVYAQYYNRNRDAVSALIGQEDSETNKVPARVPWPPQPTRDRAVLLPDDASANALSTSGACAMAMVSRIDPAGRSVLVLGGGGDWDAERVFLANGARKVLSAPWDGDLDGEAVPEGVGILPSIEAPQETDNEQYDLIFQPPQQTGEGRTLETADLAVRLAEGGSACLFFAGPNVDPAPSGSRGLSAPLLTLRMDCTALPSHRKATENKEHLSEIWMQHPQTASPDGTIIPSVSVIVPFYCVEEYIDECLRSIRSQDYPSFEIILVDDASPDGSRAVAERHAAEDSRIVLEVHDRNRGLGPSRNTGVARATGDYLIFVDSDDVMADPTALRLLVDAARDTDSQVAAGRAERLLEDGSLHPFDRELERQAGATADAIYSGEEAFLATFGQHGEGYLPMRAWGYIIDSSFYRATALEFPEGIHEDLGHMPVLCGLANQVYYAPDTVLHYRMRASSISNSKWTADHARGFVGVWAHFKTLLEQNSLEQFTGAAAMMTARQALWRLDAVGYEAADGPEIFAAVGDILLDASDISPASIRSKGMAHLSDVLASHRLDQTISQKLLGKVPAATTIEYHRSILEANGGTVLGSHDRPASKATKGPPSSPDQDRPGWSRNNDRANNLLRQYRRAAPSASQLYPSMLTEADKAVYYDAGRSFEGRGLIVDGGCFVGGTTHHLVLGLKNNPRFARDDPRLEQIVKVYDLFSIDDDYILEHLKTNFPNRAFASGDSFEGVFRDQMAADARYLQVFPGDVMRSGYQFDQDIEILGVDLCKALPVTDYVVRTFFPRLLPQALVIQQDFIHEFHPHIHLSMLYLKDYFELDAEMRWGGSVTFRSKAPIPEAVITERFGDDDRWFQDRERNVRLLEELCEKTFYNENRWVMLLTLGFYHYATGDQPAARAAYEKAQRLYPQFEPSEITRRHLCG